MSWEPDTPVGFSPCGMAFGALRKAYSAKCKFFLDSAEADNRINWYLVPDDREIYDGMTVFWPRADSDPDDAESAYEEEGQGRLVRRFNSGNDIYGFPGDHVHGDDDDFQGQSLREKYFIDDVPPDPPCHGGRGLFAKLKLRFEVVECTCHSMAVENPEFDMLITSDDYPDFDFVIVRMVLFEDVGVTGWDGQFFYPPFQNPQFGLICIPSEPKEVFVEFFDVTLLSGGLFTKEGTTGPPALFSCKPLRFDATAEAMDPDPTGKFIRFRVFGKLRYALKSKLRFDVFDPRPPVELVEKKLLLRFVVKNPIPGPVLPKLAVRFEVFDPDE